ncbi:MAG: hypothetical protein KDA89_07030 [Planctomycetaceae bacterium]|nr:hypothetical protein [Planctomycetaceae bacterium]
MSLTVRRLRALAVLVIALTAAVFAVTWVADRPLRRAEDLLEQGHPADAIRMLRSWEKQHAPTGRSQALTARCLTESGYFQNAIDIFKAVGAADTKELHAWARAYLSLEQWANALPLLQDLKSRDDQDADVLHELAACQAKLGKLEEALQTAQELLHHRESAHRAGLLIGAIELERGNKEAAVRSWEQIEQFNPQFDDLQLPADEFLTQLAGLYTELGETQRAETILTKALNIRETAEAHFQAGLAADLQGNGEQAKSHWLRALELEQTHLNAREALARLAIADGDGAAAEEILRPVVSGSEQLRSSTTFLLQRAALMQGDEERAAFFQRQTEQLRTRETIDAAVKRLLTENPNSYWSQVVRSYQFAEQGNHHQSEQLLERLPAENEVAFVTELRQAVQNRGKLPDKERMPIKLF